MNNHLSFRSGNPALQADSFRKHLTSVKQGTMSINGTVHKTGLSLFLLMLGATYTWANPSLSSIVLIPASIFGLVLAFATIFKPVYGYITVPLYSIAQGLMLGGISWVFEAKYPGIVVQAVFLTFGTLASLLLAYLSGLIKATENFKLGVVAATGGIAVVYLINMVMSLFGSGISIIQNSSLMGIAFSGFVVIIAALNLVLDFDFIEQGSEMGAPKYMEWYGAFGLMVTLIWLYLEILRLLGKMSNRR
tara:strand:+ start:2735 stop:3478 length:744 start_codon:yes stop_codon:yes gene_type:complete